MSIGGCLRAAVPKLSMSEVINRRALDCSTGCWLDGAESTGLGSMGT